MLNKRGRPSFELNGDPTAGGLPTPVEQGSPSDESITLRATDLLVISGGVPSAQTDWAPFQHVKYDCTPFQEARVVACVASGANAGSLVGADFSTDDATFSQMGASADVAVGFDVAGTRASDWQVLQSSCIGDCFFRWWTKGGNGSAIGKLGNVYLQFRSSGMTRRPVASSCDAHLTGFLLGADFFDSFCSYTDTADFLAQAQSDFDDPCAVYVSGKRYAFNAGTIIVDRETAWNGVQYLQLTAPGGFGNEIGQIIQMPSVLTTVWLRTRFRATIPGPINDNYNFGFFEWNTGVGPRFGLFSDGHAEANFIAWSSGNELHLYPGLGSTIASGFTWHDAWSSATSYVVNDLVSFSGTVYKAIASNTNQEPDLHAESWVVSTGGTWYDLIMQFSQPGTDTGTYTARIVVQPSLGGDALVDISGSADYDQSSSNLFGCTPAWTLDATSTGNSIGIGSWEIIDGSAHSDPFGLGPPPIGGTIVVSPTTLFFSAAVGGGDPSSQSVSVSATGGTVPVRGLDAGVDAAWLGTTFDATTTPTTMHASAHTGSLTAGLYTGNISIGSVNGDNNPSIPAVFAVGLTVADSFNRADQTPLGVADSGQTWITHGTTTASIVSNQASLTHNTTVNAINPSVVIDSGHADCTVGVTLLTGRDIVVRMSDGQNGFLVEYSGTAFSGTITIWRYQVVSGSPTVTSLGSASVPGFQSGTKMSVVLSGSSISAYVNGTLAVSVTSTFNQTVTFHGLSAAADSTFDNFWVSVP